MLSYRKWVLIILIGSMIIIALGWINDFLMAELVLILLLVNLGLLFTGSIFICSGLYITALCRGKALKKAVAISFDDGPHPAYTNKILDILSKYDVKAGFFLTGKKIIGNESVVRKIVEEGHTIGNHSYSHAYHYGFLSTKSVRRDLQQNNHLIKEITGKDCQLFRPPFGVTNPHIAKAVRSLGYTLVGWSIRSLDTLGRKPEKTISRIERKLKSGSLILLHDNLENAPVILEKVILLAREKGFDILPPDELLELGAYK